MSIKKALVSMRKNGSSHPARLFSDRKWLIPFLASLLVFLTLFSSDTFGVFTSSYGGEQVPFDIVSYSRPEDSRGYFVESDLKKWFDRSRYSGSEPPRFAYLISGTKGDSQRMMRTLQAVYHPRNQYILHLDLEAPPRERLMLGGYVKNDPTFQEVGNVRVMAQSNLVTYKGPTMFACTLQAIAIMLRESLEWDWFINLSASDYPLVTQDGLSSELLLSSIFLHFASKGKDIFVLHWGMREFFQGNIAIVLLSSVEGLAHYVQLPSANSFFWVQDLLHVFSNLSRNLNFIEHTQLTGWKLNSRAKPIIVDPGLYLSKKSDLYLTTQRRSLPTSFKLFTEHYFHSISHTLPSPSLSCSVYVLLASNKFTGVPTRTGNILVMCGKHQCSAWIMLTRSFLEYCIMGWDNLPRTILMYYTNFISSPEGYFHTVICNTEEFQNTAIGHDLHYIAWDSPPKQHPISLTMKDFDKMVKSNALFARKFARDDPVLDKIDKEILNRTGRFAPGAWCIGGSDNGSDPCFMRGNYSVFRPGPGAQRLQELLQTLLSEDFRKKQCS
ncbi:GLYCOSYLTRANSFERASE [Salix purpurea]|uniref:GLYCOSYLTRANSFERASE n=1 Tax=Salix purpurea TaxID=77065 RepID=A0A9Q0WAU3_SALPP|nr:GLYCOSYLTRANSFERASE [Salix purpurea]